MFKKDVEKDINIWKDCSWSVINIVKMTVSLTLHKSLSKLD